MKKMYKGKVNSPQTQIIEDIGLTTNNIKVLDASVFPDGPNLAVIGNDAQAETIKYESINENILVGCVRGFQGKAIAWKKDSVISRNFTEYDLDAIQENILELDNNKVDKVEGQGLISDTEKEKLEGIEAGANKYVHPSTHSASMITETSSKQFVSDVEKKEWNNKVDKAKGKDLSSNDFTNAEKQKLAGISAGANKVTKVSQLTNDKNFKTETEIQALINNSTKLKKEVVTSLPSTGKEDIIYLLKNKGDANNYYTEYLWINKSWEIIGDTKVDLSEYLKTRDLKSSKLRTNKNNINVFTDRSTSEHQLDIILGDLELRTEENKKNIKTKLSELTDDENHRTVTDEEKQKLNNVKLSRAATFIIANYDSSENSKAGADYVIQENECAIEIINTFIAKLPNYGGKILLTEGNFNSKKNLAINFTKNNTIIEGYGDSTTIIDKLNKDERKNVIINISDGIVNCKLLNLNIIHETSNSINIRGNNNTIQNVKIKNNGALPSVCINKDTNKNILNNVSVENNDSYCYWIMANSNNNRFTDCMGDTTGKYSHAFYIGGNNNTFTNCIGKSVYDTFESDNDTRSNNVFINCVGTSEASNVFMVRGANYSLINCMGTTNGNKRKAFYLFDKANNTQLLNCIGIGQNDSSFSINGLGVRMIGCLAKIKDTTESSIILGSGAKYCIILGNHYNTKLFYDFGANNVLVNNVKIEE